MVLDNRFILVSGSASRECTTELISLAIDFVQHLTLEILSRGGGVVVLGNNEDSTKGADNMPRIFDWVVLRQVAEFSRATVQEQRICARIIMSDAAIEDRIGTKNLMLLRDLEQRHAAEVYPIRRERFTGGEYRKALIERADGMVALGGGKGTYSIGTDMAKEAKPVLPFDLALGALSQDGNGALDLHRELLSNPGRFFPNTHEDVRNRTTLVSLNSGINDVRAAARAAAETIEAELESQAKEGRNSSIGRRLNRVWQSTKALPVVSAIIKIIESIARLVG